MAFAQRLAQDLRNAGHGIWLDKLDIPTGAKWDESIEAALRSSDALLVILSPTSVGSQNVMDEVSFTLEHERRVIPILHQTCEIPFRLRRVQYVDFTGDYDVALSDLLEDLKPGGAKSATSASPPVEAPPPEATAPRVEATAASRDRDSVAPKRGGGGFGKWIVAAVLVAGALVGVNALIGGSETTASPDSIDSTERAALAELGYIDDSDTTTPTTDDAAAPIHELVDRIDADDGEVRRRALAELENDYLTDQNAVSVAIGLLTWEDVSREGRINALHYLARTGISGWNAELLDEAMGWCGRVDRGRFEPQTLDVLADFESHLAAVA